MIDVPNPASRSIRRLTVSRGTGSEVLSYSLQYLQDRLQRRIGTMCARIGCLVENNPRDINLASRRSVEIFFITGNVDRMNRIFQDVQNGLPSAPSANPEKSCSSCLCGLFLMLNLFFLFD